MRTEKEINEAIEALFTVASRSSNGIYNRGEIPDRLEAMQEALMWVVYEWPGAPVNKVNAKSIVADRAADCIQACKLLLGAIGR